MKIKSVCGNPLVTVDLSDHLITIEGCSSPVNARHHFEPLLHMLSLPEVQDQVTKVIFSIRSVDEASATYLIMIIAMVSDLIDQGKPLELIWYVQHEEEESCIFARQLEHQFYHLRIRPLMYIASDI
ncbi:MAG: SiaC family regulatory phosphoprotein [Bacteroidota bacterium]